MDLRAGVGAKDQGKKCKKGKTDKCSQRIKDMYQLGPTPREYFFFHTFIGDIIGNETKGKDT